MRAHKKQRKVRKKTRIQSIVLQITTNTPLVTILDKVLKTGLFGNSRAAVAERLICDQVRVLLKEGVIQKQAKAIES